MAPRPALGGSKVPWDRWCQLCGVTGVLSVTKDEAASAGDGCQVAPRKAVMAAEVQRPLLGATVLLQDANASGQGLGKSCVTHSCSNQVKEFNCRAWSTVENLQP